MRANSDTLQRLRAFNSWVGSTASDLAEARERVNGQRGLESLGNVEQQIDRESIILKRERPVLAIRENAAQLVFAEAADSAIWKKRLTDAASHLDRAIRAVGRVELRGGALDWVGTAWLVHENIIVTNRHVAAEFAERRGQGFVFRTGDEGMMRASVDFLEEIDNTNELVFNLVKPLFIQGDSGPDVAFFEIERTSNTSKLASPISLSKSPAPSSSVATIGYPAYDSRIPDVALMERIYGKVYDKKRLAPGGVTRVREIDILHNCTTLGGNSGSAIINLESGEAIGLHFSGTFLTTNYAVRSDVVQKLLTQVRSGRVRPEAARRAAAPAPATIGDNRIRGGAGNQASIQVPLTITVSVGTPVAGTPTPVARTYTPYSDSADTEPGPEAVAADYRDREGYLADFLGEDARVELPLVERDRDDILPIEVDENGGKELRYEHFSVVMSRSRRMCFFSAVNIDGNRTKKNKRVAWKWDPRLLREQQIMKECYGDPPRFSRGHMTRREDPGWGSASEAKRGNEDSMHVTNATPQMQAFNAPIWLGLEDYALGHAREDKMRISVFTGPYFDDHDPTLYGVRIPRAFWKVIAFIHDETGELCATGYEMNQEGTLQPEEEFVFGQFKSPQLGIATQVSIRSIEQRSGISFGGLAGADPLGGEESVGGGGPRTPLAMLEQIRFI